MPEASAAFLKIEGLTPSDYRRRFSRVSRKAILVWRDGDFVGAAFWRERPQPSRYFISSWADQAFVSADKRLQRN
jgi:hypothetical protein